MFESKEEKKRKATRERVKRYREKQKAVTEGLQPVTSGVTASKMVCKCQYFKYVNGVLVCARCGRPAQPKIEDKIRRGIETK